MYSAYLCILVRTLLWAQRNQEETLDANCVIDAGQDVILRYGVGYILSDGSIGVYFNDSTKIILAAGLRLARMHKKVVSSLFVPNIPKLSLSLAFSAQGEPWHIAWPWPGKVPSGDLFDYVTSWPQGCCVGCHHFCIFCIVPWHEQCSKPLLADDYRG